MPPLPPTGGGGGGGGGGGVGDVNDLLGLGELEVPAGGAREGLWGPGAESRLSGSGGGGDGAGSGKLDTVALGSSRSPLRQQRVRPRESERGWGRTGSRFLLFLLGVFCAACSAAAK